MADYSQLVVDSSGRYQVERVLGHGGTSTVYLARDTTVSRLVALKVLRPELAQSIGADRFLREIRLTAQLHHPNIVAVLDSGERDGMLFCVLPYMEGGTLRDRLERERQLPLDESVAIVRTMAIALDHAHQRGLIHRDVKPENILFTGGQPCLADFGIARALEKTGDLTTSTGIVRGTPMYMSPEQASADRALDGRSDQYSLACVLYEMITGIPPFVGPTAQSVIAQRFQTGPRPARLIRDTVPPALDAVIARAMSSAPADRFPGMKAFAEALEACLDAPSSPTVARVGRGASRRRRRTLVLAATAVVVLAAASAGVYVSSGRGPSVSADTTRIVVLPFDRDGDGGGSAGELLVEALSAWRGITVADAYQVADAVAQLRRPIATNDDARAIALRLHAGRYVRSRLTHAGDSVRVLSALYDAGTQSPLYEVVMRMPASAIESTSWYRQIADSLVLRGAADSARSGKTVGSRSAPAVQSFARGIGALDGWNLAAADSLLQAALAFDPTYARAMLWLAQVRAWQQLRPWEPRGTPAWTLLARSALKDSAALSQREVELASALSALGSSRFSEACAAYERMRQRDDRDFAAWFGLGQCNALDNGVVRDARAADGYRYRSSFHQGVRAFLVAFDVLPSSHREFERGAFESLQSLLYTRSTRIRTGYLVSDDTVHFGAQPVWRGDTLVFIPRPIQQILTGHSEPAADRRRALEEQRAVFHRIATSWATPLPRSAGAKEALALSLDMLGDPAAADTMRSARALATDPLHRLQLTSLESLIRLKRAVSGQAEQGTVAARLADSLLAAHPSPTYAEAAALAPIAPVVGDCNAVRATAQAGAAPETTPVAIPQYLVGESKALAATAAMDCGGESGVAALGRLLDKARTTPGLSANGALAEQMIAAQTPTLLFPADSSFLRNLSKRSSSYLVRMQVGALDGDAGAVRAILAPIRASRDRALGDGDATPDAILGETRVWLVLRDTVEAIRTMESAFAHARNYSPLIFFESPAATGALMRLVALRAEIAVAQRDSTNARRFARLITVAWTRPSAELRPLLARMKSAAR